MRTVGLQISGPHNPNPDRWEMAAGAIIMDRIETVQIKMKSKVFNSPCETCKNFFGHLAGQCQLLNLPATPTYGRKRGVLCHMQIFLGSDAVEKTQEDTPTAALPVTLE